MPIAQRIARINPEWQPLSSHVAAVCYRLRDGEIEFLLVRTRAGRWTFPKGRVDDDPSRAHAAAREAYEEAGVFGRVDESPFTSYLHSKSSQFFAGHEHHVDAHLCEVIELGRPEEGYRDPRWFSIASSKQRLRRDRKSFHVTELERVIDSAVGHISRRHRISPR